MAHIEKRERPQGGAVYRARYRGPDGRERSKTFKKRSDAQRWLTEQESRRNAGTWVDPGAGRFRFGTFADQFMASKLDIKPKTRASYESLLRSRLLPEFGEIDIGRIDAASVDEWVGYLHERGLSATRVRQAYNLLGAIMKKPFDFVSASILLVCRRNSLGSPYSTLAI
jgi:hypothetical protein